MPELTLMPWPERPDLTAPPVFSELQKLVTPESAAEVFVVEIDPEKKGGDDFCQTYGVSPDDGANCVILEAKRGDRSWYVATLVPVGHRMDIGGAIRRLVNARKTGVASLEHVLEVTDMEYGSITAIGLPEDWTVLIDESIARREFVFLGSGRANSKLRVPGKIFNDPRFTLVEGLGIPRA